jgi:hypothetical protein
MPTRYTYAWRKGRAEDLVRAGYACERCHKEDQPTGPGYSELERAHLDGDRTNDHPDNRAVLCRTCHRRHDYAEWARKTRATRAARKDAERPILVLLEFLNRGIAAQTAIDELTQPREGA